ncbi:MAG TPA: hypothetical protein PLZ84_09135, partial [Clostridia bacterium]|nr:hypothetical protein [Clostridia bacterium]
DFADKLKAATGLALHVLSGEEEALASFTGALDDKTGTVIDIGGGSTEVISGSGGEIKHIKSVDIGVVRLLDRFSEYNPASVEIYYEYIDTVLAEFEGMAFLGGLTGVSGTVTTAAAIQAGLEKYSPQAVEGRILTIGYLEELAGWLAAIGQAGRMNVKGLDPARADVICYGLAILVRFMKLYGFDQITASDRDNLEGYLTLKLTNRI